MRRSIQYEPVGLEHIEAAMELVMAAYGEETKVVAFLPDREGCRELVRKSVEGLFQHCSGIAAFSQGELVGFLAGWKVGELFGREKGIYIPLYGHGAIKEHSLRVYQGLYRHAADLWVKEGHVSHAITLFAHAQEAVDAWFWLGFGMRCVDALREVAPVDVASPGISVEKAGPGDLAALAEIHRQHNQYYTKSPVFMPREDEDPVKDLTAWLANDNHHLWVAYRDGIPLGYMRIEPDAETFVSEHPDVMNVTGAYVRGDARQANIGSMLLGAIQQWLSQEGYPLCGVDFESINTIGSGFWLKHFTPYTYSVARRIDERVHAYHLS